MRKDQVVGREYTTTAPLPLQAFSGPCADAGGTEVTRLELRSPGITCEAGLEPDSGLWRDHLLLDIENHIRELRGRLARFAVFGSLRFSNDEAASPDAEAVSGRLHQSLKETSAAALASEMAYRKGFLRKAAVEVVAEVQDSLAEKHPRNPVQ